MSFSYSDLEFAKLTSLKYYVDNSIVKVKQYSHLTDKSIMQHLLNRVERVHLTQLMHFILLI